MTEHQCIDCIKDPPPTVRKVITLQGDPKRCTTHLREFDRRRRKQARARQVERTYDITAEDNHELYLFQGGRCWLCRKATGATKSLAVDHDHRTDEVRGRLCGPCNQFIGKLGDDPEAARRLVPYLTGDTPYRRLKAQQVLLKGTKPPVTVHSVFENDGELFANWTSPDVVIWYRTLVRRRDGVWSVRRD